MSIYISSERFLEIWWDILSWHINFKLLYTYLWCEITCIVYKALKPYTIKHVTKTTCGVRQSVMEDHLVDFRNHNIVSTVFSICFNMRTKANYQQRPLVLWFPPGDRWYLVWLFIIELFLQTGMSVFLESVGASIIVQTPRVATTVVAMTTILWMLTTKLVEWKVSFRGECKKVLIASLLNFT